MNVYTYSRIWALQSNLYENSADPRVFFWHRELLRWNISEGAILPIQFFRRVAINCPRTVAVATILQHFRVWLWTSQFTWNALSVSRCFYFPVPFIWPSNLLFSARRFSNMSCDLWPEGSIYPPATLPRPYLQLFLSFSSICSVTRCRVVKLSSMKKISTVIFHFGYESWDSSRYVEEFTTKIVK